MKKMKGYTLIELLTILAILGIVISMTMPNSDYFKTIRENNELKTFKRDVLFARNKAITESKIYKLRFLYEDNAYMIKAVDLGVGDFEKTEYFEHGIVLNKNNSIKEVLFNKNGTISNSGTIKFKRRDGKEYKLVITPVRGLVDIREVD